MVRAGYLIESRLLALAHRISIKLLSHVKLLLGVTVVVVAPNEIRWRLPLLRRGGRMEVD